MNAQDQSHVTVHSINEVARAAGVTSRTLRHYDHIGLLEPAFTAPNGYRYYEQPQILRLQRIILLRQLGLKLEVIGEILDNQRDQVQALQTHIEDLRQQRELLDRQISALRTTIETIDTKGTLDMNKTFDGFNEQYKDEVIARWGKESYENSNTWWKAQGPEGQQQMMQRVAELNTRWAELGAAGADPQGAEAQELAAEHVDWLRSIPGTPAHDSPQHTAQYVRGLADMYVNDPRFAANYQGQAAFVRQALIHHVDAEG